jgi:hypothetical protein
MGEIFPKAEKRKESLYLVKVAATTKLKSQKKKEKRLKRLFFILKIHKHKFKKTTMGNSCTLRNTQLYITDVQKKENKKERKREHIHTVTIHYPS